MADPIKYESALPALLTQLLGTKSTTKAGGGTTTSTGGSSTSTQSTANTDPLMQIFGQQMGASTPEGMQALLGELFSTGAQQVPVLTDAYANARGARSTKNSGLALAIAELNKGLTGQAAQLLGNQQAQTAQTAGAIANATKGQTATTTENRASVNPGTTSTVQSGNPKAAAGLGAAGFALNAADKMGLLKSLKGGVGNMFSGAGSGTQVLDANSLTQNYDSYDLQGGAGLQPFAATPMSAAGGFPELSFAGNLGNSGSYMDMPGINSFDLGGGMDFSGADAGGFDLSGYTDWSNGFANSGAVLDANALGDIGYDAYDLQGGFDPNLFGGGDVLADTGGGFADFLGEWFADGGLVKKESLFDRRKAAIDAAEQATVNGNDTNAAYQERLRQQAAQGKKAPGYADGGLVTSSYATAPFNHRVRLMPAMQMMRTVPMRASYADGGIVRNRNNMGGPLNRGMGSGAINYGPRPQQVQQTAQPMGSGNPSMSSSSQSGGSLNSAQLMTSPKLLERLLSQNSKREGVVQDGQGNASANSNTAVGSVASNNAAVAGMGLSALGLAGPIGALAAAAISGLTNTPSITSIAINGLMDALGVTDASGMSAATAPADAANVADAAVADSLDAAALASIAPDATAAVGDTGSDAGIGGGIGGSGNSAGDATSGDGGTGGGTGDGSGGTSASAADGGHIQGKGTGISDSIKANLSDGEFVFSKDVVDMLGVDLLQQIQNKLHTPAAVQRAAGAR